MHYFAVIATRNSLYTVERLSPNLLEVRSAWGTFEGLHEHITQAEWDNSHVKVGEHARIGPCVTTSTVQRFEEFRPASRAAHGFVRAVVDHIDAQVNPGVVFVD